MYNLPSKNGDCGRYLRLKGKREEEVFHSLMSSFLGLEDWNGICQVNPANRTLLDGFSTSFATH
jgi:hypothetical protein